MGIEAALECEHLTNHQIEPAVTAIEAALEPEFRSWWAHEGDFRAISPVFAGVEEVFRRPAHDYTRALLEAVPVPNPAVERERRRRRIEAAG